MVPLAGKIVVPCISQMATLPMPLFWKPVVSVHGLLFNRSPSQALRHRMSAKPSPLKSPTPCTLQLGSGLKASGPLLGSTVEPFMNQRDRLPVDDCCQRMSEKPSPLKSPTPTTFQSLLGL